jgi:hypothetical protein
LSADRRRQKQERGNRDQQGKPGGQRTHAKVVLQIERAEHHDGDLAELPDKDHEDAGAEGRAGEQINRNQRRDAPSLDDDKQTKQDNAADKTR